MERLQHITGCILGTAVGDAIGLPREGLSRRRAERLFGGPPLEHQLVFGRGMCSDDTEHTIMVAQALVISQGEPIRFAKGFARRLRWWFIRVPAGIGFGTARACLNLWLGFKPPHSGVPSAGNGPAMRSALLGVISENDTQVRQRVWASTTVTHTDPRAEEGARIVAHAAQWAAQDPEKRIPHKALIDQLLHGVKDPTLKSNTLGIKEALAKQLTAEAYANGIGQTNRVSGYISHTLPVALYCWLRYRGSFREAVEAAACLGGDSDTVAAITGALAGAELGPDAIPESWLNGLAEWPCSVAWMRAAAEAVDTALSKHSDEKPPQRSCWLVLARNTVFIAIVLTHGLRRLLPPY